MKTPVAANFVVAFSLGFRVSGFGFRVVRVWGLGFRGLGSFLGGEGWGILRHAFGCFLVWGLKSGFLELNIALLGAPWEGLGVDGWGRGLWQLQVIYMNLLVLSRWYFKAGLGCS